MITAMSMFNLHEIEKLLLLKLMSKLQSKAPLSYLKNIETFLTVLHL